MTGDFLGSFFLASASPRRKELLTQLGFRFQVALSGRPELPHPAKINDFKDLSIVMDIAQDKAEGAFEKFAQPKPNLGLVLAADTLVFWQKEVLGKPKDEAHAKSMLERLSGDTHTVATGISLLRILDGKVESIENRMVTTNVTFRKLSAQDIEWYISTKEPMDKAGAYGAQGYGTVLVESISGSYTNVVGLPLTETMDLITEVTGMPWQVWTQK